MADPAAPHETEPLEAQIGRAHTAHLVREGAAMGGNAEVAAPRETKTTRDLVTLVGNLRAVKDEPYTFAKSVMVSWCHEAADAIAELILERDEARAGILTPDRTQAANAALTAQVAERDKRIAVLEEALEPLAAVGRSGACRKGTSPMREARTRSAILWSYGQDDARVLLTVEDARRAARTMEPSP